MGFFSFKVSEKGKSIPNKFSGIKTTTVYMVAPDGNQWMENDYEGYGVFGGKDYYQLVAELNGFKTRIEGVNIELKKGTILPRFSETKNAKYNDLSNPVRCPHQGYFY